MKSILFVIENFRIGGIQKSLLNLLNEISGQYQIDIMAFDSSGAYRDELPAGVKIIPRPEHYKVFALPKEELKNSKRLYCYKSLFYIGTKLTNKGCAFRFFSPAFKLKKKYDIAISYSHSGFYKSVNGICPEFVLYKTQAKRKICFIHCDYENSGFQCEYNNKIYAKFDRIACCSESVRNVFIKSNPSLAQNTVTVRNFYDLRLETVNKADMDLQPQKIHIFSVARLSEEKGIDRAIHALYASKRKDICYYIIGDGPMKEKICNKITEYGMENQVFLLGAIAFPYPTLLNADYLLVPSFNEAAPIVFDEAKILGIPVIATETTSAREMLNSEDILCDNSSEGICSALKLLKKPEARNRGAAVDKNKMQIAQFRMLVDD